MIRTMLIVENNRLLIDLLKAMIKKDHPGVTIIHTDAGAAWDLIDRSGVRFDLVISNVGKGFSHGVELAEKIRKSHPDVQIILMSGGGEPKGHKAHAFLHKPFRPKDFLATIEALIENKRKK